MATNRSVIGAAFVFVLLAASSFLGYLTPPATAQEPPEPQVVDSISVSIDVDPTTLETEPVGENTNCADITVDLSADDEDEDPVPGTDIKVLILASTGRLESAADSFDLTSCPEPEIPGVAPFASNEAIDTQDEVTVTTDEDGEAIATFAFFAVTDSTLGPATLQIIVHDGPDSQVFDRTIRIVGPPANVTLEAEPAELTCGEKATLTGTVSDEIGQTVSVGTEVNLITNFGGVLVSPTGSHGLDYGGKARDLTTNTFAGILLTSSAHVGPYEVVAQVGDTFAQTTVTCSPAATPTPAVAAPDAGAASITPPNTGDAGLAAGR